MTYYLISQVLAAIAVALDLMSFQFYRRHYVLACLVVSTALTSIHYVLLQQPAGAALMALASIRYAISIRYQRRQLMRFFILCALTLGVLVMDSWWSLLAVAGSCLQTYAAFQGQQVRMRVSMLFGTCFWLAFAVIAGSPVAMVMEALFLTSNLIGLYRFRSSLTL
ncbi:YgjV family protein [Pseudoalteromonas sp. T1lg48]|uniref:YgjV family protein n=1 Tax=Pseudoalteromonas sp. T1lg48 TaxID=2077100 RepID=UPI000CF5E85B|nr:YgjV family protein [Pseudoalteromonas sp. T1lg48]